MKRHLAIAPVLAVVFLAAACNCLLAESSSVKGAIFTTLDNGTVVNANQYDSTCAVYLDGGPGPHAPAHAAGLPDGEYYFQVTDPSGKQLLSTDAVSNRSFKVTTGVITEYTGFGGPVHPTGNDQDHPELGAITIRLANTSCPVDYRESTNNGGAYKVWATPVAAFVGNPANVDNPCDSGCFHGFLASKSKTDNFKAKPQTATFCLTVRAENAYVPMPNWPISVTDPQGVINVHYTDPTGQVQICGLAQGSYTVTENIGDEYGLLDLTVNDVSLPPESIYSFTWNPGGTPPVIIFENLEFGPPI